IAILCNMDSLMTAPPLQLTPRQIYLFPPSKEGSLDLVIAEESARKTSIVYSTRCSRRNRTAWGWACRSAARLSKRMAAACGLLLASQGELSFSLSSALIAPHPPLLNDERRRAGVCWFRRERAQLCGRINRRVVECRVAGAILGGTEPHLCKPDRRDDGEISLVHWRPCEV